MNKIIAIDGESYCGKSTISTELSRLFGCIYINTGHMYRAVAFKCLEESINVEDHSSILSTAKCLAIKFKLINNQSKTIVNGKDLSNLLYNPKIISYASKIAQIPDLRDYLTSIQRSYPKNKMIIFEGRDIGTIVFPEARWKVFITASKKIRAKRMKKVLVKKYPDKIFLLKNLVAEINLLDNRDYKRKVAPLKKAPDAIIYDNSDSPSELQDAYIIQYYINHKSEIISNASILFTGKKDS
tara:strand:- start:35989 stop:36711 length:723 start_codon:yes stop_codon:yes gene_type:complete